MTNWILVVLPTQKKVKHSLKEVAASQVHCGNFSKQDTYLSCPCVFPIPKNGAATATGTCLHWSSPGICCCCCSADADELGKHQATDTAKWFSIPPTPRNFLAQSSADSSLLAGKYGKIEAGTLGKWRQAGSSGLPGHNSGGSWWLMSCCFQECTCRERHSASS